MANIISVISQNTIPGPKRDVASKNELYIVQLDGDPVTSGCECPTGTVAIYNSSMYIKESVGSLNWKQIDTNDFTDQGIIIEGSTDTPTPLDTIIRDINDGELYASIDANIAAYTKLTGPTSVPSGIIVVAKSGGDYTTIANGLAAASSGDIVLVYPGTYAESVTIPDGIRLFGFPGAQQVIISGSDTTSTRVTFSGTNTLREITVVGPSSGANPAIDASGLTAGKLAVLGNVVVQGAGGTGPLIYGAGSGIVAFVLGFYHNGGAAGQFMHFDSGTIIGACEVIANVGSVDDILKVEGTATVTMTSLAIQDSSLYTATDGIELGGTANLEMGGMLISRINTGLTNGIHITADGINGEFIGCNFWGSTYDILVDPALTGTNSQIVWSSSSARLERSTSSSSWATNASQIGFLTDPGENDDKQVRSIGEFSVGLPEKGSETSLGRGDSTTRGMLVYTDDGTGTNFVDVTEEAKSSSGSTFTTQGTGAGQATIYVGSQLGYRMTDIKIDNDTAAVLSSGDYVAEVWTGATYEAIGFMQVDGEGRSADSLADMLFTQSGTGKINIDFTCAAASSWTTNDPGMGETAHWIRFRNANAITSGPVIERLKTGFCRTEFNFDGSQEANGSGERPTVIWKGNGENMSAPTGGANSPGNLDITLTTNVTYRQARSKFANGNDESAGTQFVIPYGVDTSRPLRFTMNWFSEGTSTNAVAWEVYVAQTPAGSVLNSTTVETQATYDSDSDSLSPDGVANKIYTSTWEVYIPTLVPGDQLGFTLWRQGNTDTNPNQMGVLSCEWEALFWR